MISVVILALYDYLVAFDLDILGIGDHRDLQMLRDLGANLRGIAVDSLTACDNQVILQIADGACNGGGGSPGIRAAQHPVCHQNALVRTHGNGLTQHVRCLGKPHGKHGYLCTVLVFQTQCRLQASFVIRVHNGQHSASIQSSVGIKLNAALGIRNLLNTNDNLHRIFTPFLYFTI